MGRQHQIWRLVCLTALLNSLEHSAFAAHQHNIVLTPSSCSNIHSWDGVTKYTLALATFKQKKEAQAYRNQISQVIKYPMYVSYVNTIDSYAVIISPINNPKTLNQICQKIQTKPKKSKNILDFLFTPKSTQTSVSLNTIKAPTNTYYPNKPIHHTKYIDSKKTTRHAFAQRYYSAHPKVPPKLNSVTYKHVKHESIAPWGTKDKDAANNSSFESRFLYSKSYLAKPLSPIPYIGMTTGPVLNTSGSPATYAGWQGTAFGGFGAYLNPWFYLGAEIFGSNSKLIKKVYDRVLPENPQTGWTYGVNILPGFMINDYTMVYGRFGVVNSYFLASEDHVPGDTRGGWQVGLGGQSNLTKNLDFRLEYVFTEYRKRFPFETHVSRRATMYGDAVNFGLVYKFNS